MPKRFTPMKGTKPNMGRSRARDPSATFALDHDLITADERAACERGNMEVDLTRRTLLNLNVDERMVGFRTGERVKIYPGRGTAISMAHLLGLDPHEETFDWSD